MGRTRWLFGDQLGPHFLDDGAPTRGCLLIESRPVFAPPPLPPRQGAPRALRDAAPGRRARATASATSAPTTYAEALGGRPLQVIAPDAARRGAALRSLAERPSTSSVLPARGFVDQPRGLRRLGRRRRGQRACCMEDFYRDARRRHDVLMDGAEPAGGRWNFDADNREPPPKRSHDPRRRRAAGGRSRTRSTTRSARDLDRWERDGERQLRRPRRPAPVRRHPRRGRWPRCEHFVDAPAADLRRRTRTPCSPATRGWRTRCSRRR